VNRVTAFGLGLFVAVAWATGVCGCGSDVDTAKIREDALGALESATAWKIVTEGEDGHTVTEWWSANSSLYRWDDSFNGEIMASTATDGKVLLTPAPDGSYYAQDLGADSERHPNPTAFASYYWYLKDGRPVETPASPNEPGVLTLVLRDAPSGLTARLSAGTFLPFEFESTSEMTGQLATSTLILEPTDMSALEIAVDALRSKPAPEHPDISVQDHLVTSLQAAGIDCYSAKSFTNQATQTNVLDLMVQVPPEERSAENDEALALTVLSSVREYQSSLDVNRVYIQILSVDKAPIYEVGFDLD
jgi:hypothetical protein